MAERETYKLQISVEVDKEQGQTKIQELTKTLENNGFRINEINKELNKTTNELTKSKSNLRDKILSLTSSFYRRFFCDRDRNKKNIYRNFRIYKSK